MTRAGVAATHQGFHRKAGITKQGTERCLRQRTLQFRMSDSQVSMTGLAIGRFLGDHNNMKTHVVIKTLAEVPALDDDQLVEVADVLRLMGDPTRLRILLACLAQPAPVGELAARLEISRARVSHHLRLLRSSRLLRATRDGKQVIYSEADDRVRCIVTDLAQHVLGAPEDDD